MVALSPIRLLAWFGTPLAGMGILFWVLVPAGFSEGRNPQPASLIPAAAASQRDESSVDQAMSMIETGSPDALIRAYGEWAADSATTVARRVILRSLFVEKSVPLRLSHVL